MSSIKLTSQSVIVTLFSLVLCFTSIASKPRSLVGDTLDVVVTKVPSGFLVTLTLGDLSGEVIHQKYEKKEAQNGINTISINQPVSKYVTGVIVQIYSSSSHVEGTVEDMNSKKATLNLKVDIDSLNPNKNIWYDVKLLSSGVKYQH